METKGKEFWVGLFVLAGIVTICGMILHYGKFRERLKDMYTFDVRFENAGQIARGAPVILAGVTVGKVETITLEKEGTVRLTLAIWRGIKIHQDAHFTIKQAGLLGDLRVMIVQGSNRTPLIQENEVVTGTNPTDIQDTLAQAAQIVVKLKSAADNIESATSKLDRQVMNEETLIHLRSAISNASVVTAKASLLLDDVHGLVGKTTTGIDTTLANLNQFSTNLSIASSKTLDIVQNNEGDIRTAVQNLRSSTEHLNTVLANVEGGKGNLGWMLKDESFHEDLRKLFYNLRRFGILKYKDAPIPGESKHETDPAVSPSSRSKY